MRESTIFLLYYVKNMLKIQENQFFCWVQSEVYLSVRIEDLV